MGQLYHSLDSEVQSLLEETDILAACTLQSKQVQLEDIEAECQITISCMAGVEIQRQFPEC
jgi:hypothetical protein